MFLKADFNSNRFQLSMGMHPDKRLTELWKLYDEEGFEFSVVKILKYESPDDDHTEGEIDTVVIPLNTDTPPAGNLKKSSDSKGKSSYTSESVTKSRESDTGEEGAPVYHELTPEEQSALAL